MHQELTQWLLEYGGSVIRYRTATELLKGSTDIDLDGIKKDLLESTLVKSWLEHLVPGEIHSSRNTAFENAINRLADLGLRAGMGPLDEKATHFRSLLSNMLTSGEKDVVGMLAGFERIILAAGLLRAGYGQEDYVTAFFRRRLDAMYKTCRKGSYDIYMEAAAHAEIPQAFQKQRFVRPEFILADVLTLPYIHDIYILAQLATAEKDETTAHKIETIIRYALDSRYKTIEDGYGYLRTSTEARTKYYAIGWSAHLPDLSGPKQERWDKIRLVQRMELMAHFPAAWENRLFLDNLAHLESFRTERGTYLLPRDYLMEQKAGYWVTGAHMGLEENRRSSQTIELESTFRMLKIKAAR